MSHTSSINSIKIIDLGSLKSACRELMNNQGINITLLENVKPRAYYENQAGLNTPADLCLKLEDSRYDVGIYKVEGENHYEARCDMWAGEVAKTLGADPAHIKEGDNQDQAQLGKLYQMYAIHQCEKVAASNGQITQRVSQSDGSISLVIPMAA